MANSNDTFEKKNMYLRENEINVGIPYEQSYINHVEKSNAE